MASTTFFTCNKCKFRKSSYYRSVTESMLMKAGVSRFYCLECDETVGVLGWSKYPLIFYRIYFRFKDKIWYRSYKCHKCGKSNFLTKNSKCPKCKKGKMKYDEIDQVWF